MKKYQEMMTLIETNHRDPLRHNSEKRGLYHNWLKQNKKAMNSPLYVMTEFIENQSQIKYLQNWGVSDGIPLVPQTS